MIPGTFATVVRALFATVIVAAGLHAPAAHANGRVALLIGNNAYPTAPLRNAVNDSRDLGEVLRELGFKTIVKENTSRAQMIAALQEFGKALEGADAALFFYAGHAMQFKDRNYLIPIDAVMGSEEDVTFFSVDVSQVLDRMERARTRFNFVILDACRDNPFRDTFKVSAAGLAQMSGPSGSLIAYATAPGATAADGFGRNGVYTGQILQNIKVPDMPVEVLFRKVREGVERETKRLQTPWELSSIKGDFVFNASGRSAATAGGGAGGGPSADVSAQMELQFWKSVEGSNRADDIQAYIDKYPNGVYARLARNRIDTLLGRSRQTVASAPATAPTTAPATAPSAGVPPSASPPPAAEPRPAPATDMVPPETGRKPSPPPGEGKPPVAAQPVAEAADKPTAAAQPSPAAAPPPPKPKDDLPGKEIAPGIRELVFADGSIYRGAVRGLQLHGKGEYESKAFKYQGEFKDGLKHGNGTYVWGNGDRYEGEFVEDKPSGKGKWQFANGDTYEGELRAGVITGRGVYVTRGGDRIEGSFTAGIANGVGIYRFASGDRYEGEMVGGRLQGKGRYYTKGGDRIEGTFADGKPQGKGIYFFANGDRYDGDMQGGALTGQGTYFHANGSKYEGAMVNAVPQGKGAFWFLDGSRFEGVFENGLAKASGEMVKPDGARRKAEIVDGNVKHLD